jgi:hypothetical protein
MRFQKALAIVMARDSFASCQFYSHLEGFYMMNAQMGRSKTHKISSEFAARLEELAPNQTVRVIVLPTVRMRSHSQVPQDRRARRAAVAVDTKRFNETALAELDAQLMARGGCRLTSSGAGNLGFVVVETTLDGIDAIVELDWVGAIIEDQPIHSLNDPQAPDALRPAHRYSFLNT